MIVSRYDRTRRAQDEPQRVHQEDICQALGIDPIENRGRIKYERYGGPTFIQIAKLLSATADNASLELDRLVQVMTFNVLIGNADAHGKNISLLHDPLGTVRLAPLYDTVPTLLRPKLRATSAMRINGQDAVTKITVADIVAEAGRWGHSPRRATTVATDLVDLALAASESASVPTNVTALVRKQARQLRSFSER